MTNIYQIDCMFFAHAVLFGYAFYNFWLCQLRTAIVPAELPSTARWNIPVPGRTRQNPTAGTAVVQFWIMERLADQQASRRAHCATTIHYSAALPFRRKNLRHPLRIKPPKNRRESGIAPFPTIFLNPLTSEFISGSGVTVYFLGFRILTKLKSGRYIAITVLAETSTFSGILLKIMAINGFWRVAGSAFLRFLV